MCALHCTALLPVATHIQLVQLLVRAVLWLKPPTQPTTVNDFNMDTVVRLEVCAIGTCRWFFTTRTRWRLFAAPRFVARGEGVGAVTKVNHWVPAAPSVAVL